MGKDGGEKTMNDLFKDWKVHLFCAAISIVAELIGVMKFSFTKTFAFSLYPMIYAIAFGIFLCVIKVIKKETMVDASPYSGIAVMILCAKIALGIGPNVQKILSAGPALLLQEFGNIGTALIGVPIAVFVFKMGRAAIGCTCGISREGTIAVIGDMYGLDTPEGMGVMGGYVTGTVIGTLFYSIMASIMANISWFHPYALGMACGVGSASMMAASLAPLTEKFPDMAETISSYAAASNALSNADSFLMLIFLTLPLTNWWYKTCCKLRGLPVPEPSKKATDANK